MNILATEIEVPSACSVTVTDEALHVELSDGRAISVPLAWYPRLVHASHTERNDWRLIARGRGIHWDAIDEDISIEGLLAGRVSSESQLSLKRWLTKRHATGAERRAHAPKKHSNPAWLSGRMAMGLKLLTKKVTP